MTVEDLRHLQMFNFDLKFKSLRESLQESIREEMETWERSITSKPLKRVLKK